MEKKSIVKELLKRGIMITPDTLEKMKPGDDEKILEEGVKGASAVVKDGKEENRLRCVVKRTEKSSKLTPEDAINAVTTRYEKIKNMLLTKTDAVSIRNLGRSTSKLCIIGQVKEKTPDGFTFEDSTGEIRVKTEKNTEPDDVIAIRGWVRENTLFAEELIYPDIPMNREINVMDGTLLLSGERAAPTQTADVVLTPDTMMSGKDERRLPNPAWVFLEKNEKRVTVLVYRPRESVKRETAVSWLKKRYIDNDDEPVINKDRILEKIPDIVWLINKSVPWAENYKGVTVVSTGPTKQAFINLKTRKVEIV